MNGSRGPGKAPTTSVTDRAKRTARHDRQRADLDGLLAEVFGPRQQPLDVRRRLAALPRRARLEVRT